MADCASSEVGHLFIWGGKGHVVLAAPPNIWVHRGNMDGVGQLQRPSLPSYTKGAPALTQHKVKPPPDNSMSNESCPSSVFQFDTHDQPALLFIHKHFDVLLMMTSLGLKVLTAD